MTLGEAVENPSAFLYRTAVNLMLDRRPGQHPPVRRPRRRLARRTQGHTYRRRRHRRRSLRLEQATASRQRLRPLVDAVGTRPPQTRRAFELHKFEGLSHAERRRYNVWAFPEKQWEKQISAALKALIVKLGKTD